MSQEDQIGAGPDPKDRNGKKSIWRDPFSRRTFLRASALVTAGSALAAAGVPQPAEAQTVAPRGPDAMAQSEFDATITSLPEGIAPDDYEKQLTKDIIHEISSTFHNIYVSAGSEQTYVMPFCSSATQEGPPGFHLAASYGPDDQVEPHFANSTLASIMVEGPIGSWFALAPESFRQKINPELLRNYCEFVLVSLLSQFAGDLKFKWPGETDQENISKESTNYLNRKVQSDQFGSLGLIKLLQNYVLLPTDKKALQGPTDWYIDNEIEGLSGSTWIWQIGEYCGQYALWLAMNEPKSFPTTTDNIQLDLRNDLQNTLTGDGFQIEAGAWGRFLSSLPRTDIVKKSLVDSTTKTVQSIDREVILKLPSLYSVLSSRADVAKYDLPLGYLPIHEDLFQRLFEELGTPHEEKLNILTDKILLLSPTGESNQEVIEATATTTATSTNEATSTPLPPTATIESTPTNTSTATPEATPTSSSTPSPTSTETQPAPTSTPITKKTYTPTPTASASPSPTAEVVAPKSPESQSGKSPKWGVIGGTIGAVLAGLGGLIAFRNRRKDDGQRNVYGNRYDKDFYD